MLDVSRSGVVVKEKGARRVRREGQGGGGSMGGVCNIHL